MRNLLTLTMLLLSIFSFSQTLLIDKSNYLSPVEQSEIEKILRAHEKNTSIEISILLVDTMNGDNIDNFKYQAFNEMGVGKKGADNGLLFVFSIGDRKSGVEIGDGLISIMTSHESSEYLQIIKPYFREGLYGKGIKEMLTPLLSKITPEAIASKQAWLAEQQRLDKIESDKRNEAFMNVLTWLMYIVLSLSFFGYVGYLSYKRYIKLKKIKEVRKSIIDNKLLINEHFNDDIIPNNKNEKIYRGVLSNKTKELKQLYDNTSDLNGDSSDLTILTDTNLKLIKILHDIIHKKNDIKINIDKINSNITNYKQYKQYFDYKKLDNMLFQVKKKNDVLNEDLKENNIVFDKIETDINSLKVYISNLDTNVSNSDSYYNMESEMNKVDTMNNSIIDDINKYNYVISNHISDYAKYSDKGTYSDLITKLEIASTKYGELGGFNGTIKSLERCMIDKLDFNDKSYVLKLKSLKNVLDMGETLYSQYIRKMDEEERIKREKRAEIARKEEERLRKIREEEERKRLEERKRREEEEEERNRRNNSYNSYSSYNSYGSSSSSSSSSSDFDFGGGSSSGMGSSDSW